MKRLYGLLLILLIVILPCRVFANDRTQVLTDRVSGGVLSDTNVVLSTRSEGGGSIYGRGSMAKELTFLAFKLPTASLTNTVTLRHIRIYKLPDLSVDVATTNSGLTFFENSTGTVTQSFKYAQGTITFTNDFSLTPTTNDVTSQIYDTDDFPKNWSLEPNDIFEYRFSETNAFDLIRGFNIFQRP